MVDNTNPPSPIHILPPNAGQTVAPKPVPVAGAAGKAQAKPAAKKSGKPNGFSTLPFWGGLTFSAAWIVAVALALLQSGATHSFAGLPLVNWALGITAVTAPVGLIWMVAAYLQRAADVQAVAEPLRRQLLLITGESGLAEQRIRRFNQVIREQLELLRDTRALNQEDLMSLMDRVREHKSELDQFEQNSLHQVKEIQEVVSRSMQHIEQVMDDKFTMLRILDGKMAQSGETVARQTDVLREQLSSLLQEVEANSNLITISLERAMHDSKKLADTARAQEASIIGAADTAAGTLGELSGKIDLNIARFLERASSAREEAERLASALDAQTRSLDEFTAVLPSRVGEAEAVLRGVADRLYASEQLAREQTVALSEKLAGQVDSLQQMLDKFSSRFTDIDGTMQQRRSDLDGLVERIGGASDELARALETSIGDLGDRADGALERYRSVNVEARRGVEDVAVQLAETAARYEEAASTLHQLTGASKDQMQALTREIGDQLSQFENLQNAARKAGEEVQGKATGAMQNLQYVLERLLAARDATQVVGEALTDKLRKAVDENETLIVRINEAAQMSVRALGIATEALGRQEGDLSNQTRSAEATLREAMAQLEAQAQVAEQTMRTQTNSLTGLLSETTAALNSTEGRMNDFAAKAVQPVQSVLAQIDQHTETGLQAMGRYGDNMQIKLDALQQFNAQVSSMGDSVARGTSSALDTIEQLNARFVSLRAAQDEVARATVEQFNAVAERLQAQVGTLDTQASSAVKLLQDAASKVGSQAENLLRDAQDSGAKMQLVTAALQGEAAQTRAALQKQADDLGADLARAEQQFTSLGESLKQRTDVAYALIDRVAVHYNEMTREVVAEFDARTAKLEDVTTKANSKVETLNETLNQQLAMIGMGATQVETNATQMSGATAKALQQLTSLSEKLVASQEQTAAGAQAVVSKMEEANSAYIRQHTTLSDTAQSAVSMIQKAGGAFGEQASKMLDTTNQAEQQIRSLSATTASLADQTGAIRSNLETQSQQIVAKLAEAVAQMDQTSNKLQQVVATATLGADQANERFNSLTQNATARIGASSQDLVAIADKTETSLQALSGSMTQQVGALNLISEQLLEQHTSMSTANENQRVQLVDMFDKLGGAHAQASEVAERTIARLADSLQQIQRQLGTLSDTAQSSVSNVRTASGGFADQATLLIQHAQQAEQQARTVLSVTGALQDQAKQLRESLQQDGERTNELLGTLLGKLAAGSTELRDLGATAESTLTSLQVSVNQQTTAFTGTMQQIADRQRSLTTSLDAQRDVLNGLLCRLTLAQDETAASAERSVARLTDSTQQISTQLEAIDSQAQSTLAKVRTAGAGLSEESQKLQQNAEAAENQAKSVLSVTAALQDQARQMREGLQAEAERTGEILSGLLAKIAAGGTDLRDIGGSTNASLSSLQQQVTEQVASLTSAMQQIGERQRAMTASLDQQRDSLNTVLGRLTLAQDETAATTERSVARLTDSSKQIVKQIETIDTQAQNTLASVRTVSSTLADETGTLQLQSQQAEQQLRNMLTIASGLQDQARQMREQMADEAGKIIASIGSVTARLENTTTDLKQQSSVAVHSVDEAALQFGAMVRSGCEALQQQTENLTTMTQNVETSISGSSEKIRGQMRLISEAGEQADQKARNLAETADFAHQRLVTLKDTMETSDSEGRALLSSASERIETVKSKLYDELQHIADVSDAAVRLIRAASEGLETQSDTLRANVASTESALMEAADLMRTEGAQLPAVMARGTSMIESANQALKEQASSASESLVKTADRFIGVTGSIRDTMMDEMRDLDHVATTAEQTLRSFTSALGEQLVAMQNGSGILATEQQTLVAAANQTLSQLVSANERLHTLHQDAAATAEQVSSAFANVEQRADSANAKLSQVSMSIAQQIENLAETTSRAENQMSGASQSFRDQLERIRAGVQTQIDDINRGLMQITAQLERTGTSLRTSTAASVADVEKVGVRFEQTSREASTQLADRTARMRVATEDVAKLLNGFGDQLDVLLDRMSVAGDGIKRHESDILGQLSSALGQLGSVAERLEANRLLTANVSDQAVSRLAEVADAVEKQMSNLTSDSQTVADIVRGVGRMYGEQADTLNRGVSDAQNQVMAMEQTIDSLQQRTDRMRVSLKLQGDELIGSLEQILQQLSTAGDIMGDTVDDITRRSSYQEGNQKIG